MLRSLVGSEMCIRDRSTQSTGSAGRLFMGARLQFRPHAPRTPANMQLPCHDHLHVTALPLMPLRTNLLGFKRFPPESIQYRQITDIRMFTNTIPASIGLPRPPTRPRPATLVSKRYNRTRHMRSPSRCRPVSSRTLSLSRSLGIGSPLTETGRSA
eukprot:TRINITY_DN24301_c0_g1_i4.p1 TRINITY_DN24301_c0_g1~~TRINITY_DN24301_c0_g1_i4.p1  ORF type:complete len:176 (-),score=32.36 TRINITY_DN24301_c0_g1_i4:154-621(-)